MCKILLDIGAGGSSFVKYLRNYNSNLDVYFLIGEPEYDKLWDCKISWWRRIKKIQASYHDFGVRSSSLDFVTLNAPHPLVPLTGFNEELVRCLKKGGYFISAHPVGWHPAMDATFFREVCNDNGPLYFKSSSNFFKRYEATLNLEGYGSICYPASPTIKRRLSVLESEAAFENLRFSVCYLYAGMRECPTVRVWQRL